MHHPHSILYTVKSFDGKNNLWITTICHILQTFLSFVWSMWSNNLSVNVRTKQETKQSEVLFLNKITYIGRVYRCNTG